MNQDERKKIILTIFYGRVVGINKLSLNKLNTQ